jgi:hypothetical protein
VARIVAGAAAVRAEVVVCAFWSAAPMSTGCGPVA